MGLAGEANEIYTVIDIETTGGNYKMEKITEIAVYKYDGEEIIDEFTTLINPECNIPYFITNLTGITNEMVKNAPKFYEVARKIVEITENAIFVAHNVSFDYNFIRQEFKNLGYEFHRKQLCTVRTSRKLIPGLPSYSLGNLCNSLGIEIHSRHRAAGDALATVQVLKHLLQIDEANKIKQSLKKVSYSGMHPDFDPGIIPTIPDTHGVYYFYNSKNDLIYIGKSIHLKTRIISHFGNERTQRALEMKASITRIKTEETGNELIALLKESHEIKVHKPLYNRAQRRSIFTVGLFTYIDQYGYIRMHLGKIKNGDQPVTTFSSMEEAKSILHRNIETYKLCQKLCGLYQSDASCFHYGIQECNGACIQKESPELYNSRAQELLNKYQFGAKSILILDQGRTANEKSIIYIRNGQYIGYGYYIPEDKPITNETLIECIMPYTDNREIRQIIQYYLLHSEQYQIKELE